MEEKKSDVVQAKTNTIELEKEVVEVIEEVIKDVKEITVEIVDFEMSPTIGAIAGALAKAQGGMYNGAKDKEGYGYSYMELGSVIDIARPELSKNGLSVIQSHSLNKKGKSPSVFVHTLLMHSSGEWFKNSLEVPISQMKQLSQPQMMGVSMTYGRRYSLQALLMIASEEDTDGKSE